MKTLFALLLLVLSSFSTFATHLKGGEITYKLVNAASRTVEITLVLYRDTGPGSVDQPTVKINFGDGSPCQTSKILARDQFGPFTELITTKVLHSYPGDGEYIISFNEENRNENITNIDNGNSVNLSFYIESLIKVDVFNPNKNSFLFFKNASSSAIVGETLSLTNFGYDPDGDSLAFSFVKPLFLEVGKDPCDDSEKPSFVPGYFIPDSAQINPFSGNIHWTPKKEGYYTFSVKVSEFREGELIGYVKRDFQVEVLDADYQTTMERTDNNDLKPFNVLAITAAQPVTLSVRYIDNELDSINIEAFSELIVNNIGSFTVTDSANYKVGRFTFTPTSSLTRDQPYIFTFRGTSMAPVYYLTQDFTYVLNTKSGQEFVIKPPTPNNPEEPPLGFTDRDRLTQIDFYPNPSREAFFVNTYSLHSPEIVIYNSAGSFIRKHPLPRSQKAEVARGTLVDGLYLFILQSNGQRVGWGKVILE